MRSALVCERMALDCLCYSPIGPCPMQLVTPSVVAMAVNIEIANCRIIFQISFFIVVNSE